jgi:hypothetical protein
MPSDDRGTFNDLGFFNTFGRLDGLPSSSIIDGDTTSPDNAFEQLKHVVESIINVIITNHTTAVGIDLIGDNGDPMTIVIFTRTIQTSSTELKMEWKLITKWKTAVQYQRANNNTLSNYCEKKQLTQLL